MVKSLCLVAPCPPPYGGITHWVTLLLLRVGKDDSVTVKVIDTSPRWRSIGTVSPFIRALGGALQLLRDWWRFVIFVTATKVDVVHLTTSGAFALWRDAAILGACKVAGIPSVLHVHYGRLGVMSRSNFEFRLFLRVAGFASAVVAIDGRTFDRLVSNLPSRHIYNIPNFIDLDSLPSRHDTNVDGARKKVVFLGWVVRTKGVEELLNAWSKLSFSGWNLEIIGPCEEAYLAELKAAYPLSTVTFAGSMAHSEAMRSLSQADVFVLPSHTEGFPNVILEAMAMGLAIVASDVGAIPEMLADDSGLLCSPKDVEGLTAALAQVMGSSTLRTKLASRAISRVKSHYSLDVIYAEYANLWSQVISIKS